MCSPHEEDGNTGDKQEKYFQTIQFGTGDLQVKGDKPVRTELGLQGLCLFPGATVCKAITRRNPGWTLAEGSPGSLLCHLDRDNDVHRGKAAGCGDERADANREATHAFIAVHTPHRPSHSRPPQGSANDYKWQRISNLIAEGNDAVSIRLDSPEKAISSNNRKREASVRRLQSMGRFLY